MSVLFQSALNVGKLYLIKNSVRSSLSCQCFYVKKYSDFSPRKFVTFDEVVAQRRAETRRSVVVQVNSESSFNELFGYCSKYSDINGIHHYKNNNDEHFMVIEFKSEDDLKEVLKSCSSHHKDLDVSALKSPFLWFRCVPGKKQKLVTKSDISLVVKDGTSYVDEAKLLEDLLNCSHISEQIETLYDRTKLNDLGVRLRYLVARQLEVVCQSLYSNIAVQLFGSSVNGFGRLGCDLDLVLTNTLTEEMMDTNKRLVFQEKKCEGGRSPWQRHMELVGDVIELRVPGAARVQRILNARVPIVKYHHHFTGLDCDLAYSNMSGVFMSELLWLLGSLDPRVPALTFLVRRWAASVGLTSPHPGRWVTNFPLTLMVLFFLQQSGRNGPVLPPLKFLVKNARKEDVRIAEESINCTFLRDLNQLPRNSYGQNTDNLATLLLGFFEFYSQFDFKERAISLNEGAAIRKPNALPLYIVNPLEQALNVSRNVSYEECERLKVEVRNAAWLLESCEQEKGDDWGILGLIEKKSVRGLRKLLRVGNSHRLVSVKDLFSEDTSKDTSEEGLKSKLERLMTKTKSSDPSESSAGNMNKEQVKFKNSTTKAEIFRIQRDKMV